MLRITRSYSGMAMVVVTLACGVVLVAAVTGRDADAGKKARVSTYQTTDQTVLPPQARPPEIVA